MLRSPIKLVLRTWRRPALVQLANQHGRSDSANNPGHAKIRYNREQQEFVKSDGNSQKYRPKRWFVSALFTAGGLSAGAGFWFSKKSEPEKEKQIEFEDAENEAQNFPPLPIISSEPEPTFLNAPKRPELPVYTRKDVADHRTPEKGIWVTYQEGVYDITHFVAGHPGGDNILLAAGGTVEPFWAMYAQHKTEQTMEILEELRIGNLDPAETQEQFPGAVKGDPFAHEPLRHPALIPNSLKPFNAEVPPDLLVDSFYTPNELFFVRNHLPVPDVDELKEYKIKLDCFGENLGEFTVEELKNNFPPTTVTVAIQCAGNRRSEMSAVKPVKGLTWGFTAISNAQWTGVKLKDLLLAAGVDIKDDKIKHVQFEGMDTDPTGQIYGASVPFKKALKCDALIAYEMNGKPMSRDHGFPLRAIVPGVIGARHVKWLRRINLSEEESGSHWQQKDYRSFSPSADFDQVDYSSAPAIQDAPVQSAICSPLTKTKVKKGTPQVEVKGYAYSGGGCGVIRVDVTADGGRTWYPASLVQAPEQKWHKMYAWTLWHCSVPIPLDAPRGSKIEVTAKATNLAYNTQPEHPDAVWNFRGLLNNSWHRIELIVT